VDERVLVTGGCGFLGQHLVRRLAAAGMRVDVVDIQEPPTDFPARSVIADVRDWLPTTTASYDLVIHLAAFVGGRTSIEDKPMEVAANIAIDHSLFEYLGRAGCGRLVYLSSSAVYPIDRQQAPGDSPLAESEVNVRRGPFGVPDLTYGWAKLTGEFMGTLLADSHGIPVVIYRPFSVYGPGQADSYPMTAIMRRALDRQDPLTVWGSGLQQRDFVYIDDFLNIVLETYAIQPSTVPLNIATGTGKSFRDIARIIADIAGYSPEFHHDHTQPEGVLWRVGSAASLNPSLQPAVALEEGIKHLAKHLRGIA
jgi:UDP-glucose 4-epimerase